jgi:histidinol dehydrogenase
VVLATPPKKNGSICPEVVYAAKRGGATHILKAGGAQAIAAMGFGTSTCPKVHKILGPGNQFVTATKMLLQGDASAGVAIDMPAGPSEQLCIFDAESESAFVVADLLSQAEHGVDSQVVGVLVCPPEKVENKVASLRREFTQQVEALSRKDITTVALSKSFVIHYTSREEAVAFSNDYAPEHLCIQTEDPEAYLAGVTNAGSVFMGKWAPESCGDYASGTNHCLPTSGFARQYGGVSLDTFIKMMTVQKLTPEGLQRIGPHVEALATIEGLDAHCNAVTVRLAQCGRLPGDEGRYAGPHAKRQKTVA